MDKNIKENDGHKLLIPVTSEDVTPDWFESILNIKIDRNSFTVTGNVNAGVGFLSNLVRVHFEEVPAGGNKKEYSLVVKLLPSQDMERELIFSEKMDQVELHFYQKLIPEIVHEIPSLESFFCPFIYGDVQEENLERAIPYASVLILRDLKKDGYVLKPFNTQEMNKDEIELTIDFFANFHVASALLEMKKQAQLSEVYDIFPDWYYPNESNDRVFVYHNWFIDGFKSAKEVLIDYSTNTNPSVRSSGEKIVANLVEPFAPYAKKILNELLRAGQQYPTMVHGDLWQNNLLILPGDAPSIKVIDWQLAGYTDNVYDVAIFLLTSLHPRLSLENVERHTKMYFDKLENVYNQKEKEGKDFSGRKRRSWEEFWQAMKTYGFTFVYFVYILSFNQFADSPDILRKVYECFRFFHEDTCLPVFLKTLIK